MNPDRNQAKGSVPGWLSALGVEPGEYYSSSKARPRRLMRNSLSSEARRVYACLELATMAFQQELAVKMDKGKRIPISPGDLAEQTGLSKQHVRRAMEELEQEGLAERRPLTGNLLTKGNIGIYSWAVPRRSKEKNGSHARLPFPDWFPDSWEPLRTVITRYRYQLPSDEEAARGYLEPLAEAAQDYQRAEKVALELLDRVCARTRPNKEERNREKPIERNPPPTDPPVSEVEESISPLVGGLADENSDQSKEPKLPKSSVPNIAEQVQAHLTENFDIAQPLEKETVGEIAELCSDQTALERFKEECADVPRHGVKKPRHWTFFKTIAQRIAQTRPNWEKAKAVAIANGPPLTSGEARRLRLAEKLKQSREENRRIEAEYKQRIAEEEKKRKERLYGRKPG